ncbi:MAG: hypothetical protein U1D31_02800 [Patescibacteria group bacterium]|nr:hypothetical protein [bacterium]MDZ4241021.1 hypothetical protein [Patescibacteria group bacterium]
MEPTSPENKINKLKDNLYSRKFIPQSPYDHSKMSEKKYEVGGEWKHDQISVDEALREKKVPQKRSWLTILFVGAAAFFLLSVATAVYMFYGGSIIVSSKNVDISVVGPISVQGGEELTLDILIHNKNTAALESAVLTVEYPLGTKTVGNLEEELLRDREGLEIIPAGGVVKKTVKAVLFGEKENIKPIKITLEYRITGSNAIFAKEINYDVTISSSPVTLSLNYPPEVNANQPFQIEMTVTSNSNDILRNLLLKTEYPFGFRFDSSVPQSISENMLWRVGDLEPAGQRKIVITGRIEGQNEEERTFRFDVGIASKDDNKTIGVNFLSILQSVLIKKPSVDLALKINQEDTQEYIAPIGTKIPLTIEWFNTLPVNVLNGTLEVKLSGSALDRASVVAKNGGFYRSIDNTVLWDKNGYSFLGDLGPKKTGSVSFDFSLVKELSTVNALRNPEVLIEATFKGTRFSSDGTSEEVISTVTKRIKVSSGLVATGRVVYSTGPFSNSGPIPPKAEVPTTYSVILAVTNSVNSLSDVVLHTSLPPYVSWLNKIDTASESITFDPSTRELVWNIGDVPAGTGISLPVRQVALQVSFLPSLGQIGASPILLNATKISGKDTFTGTTIQNEINALTTKMSTDPNAFQGHDRVTQ